MSALELPSLPPAGGPPWVVIMPSLFNSPFRLLLLGSVALGLIACTLNPQPEDPFVESNEPTGGSATGGRSVGELGGSGTGGTVIVGTGGNGAMATGGMPPATGGTGTGGQASGTGGAGAAGGTSGSGGTSASGGWSATGGAGIGGRDGTGGASTGGASTGGAGTGGTQAGGASATGGSASSGGGAGGAPGLDWCEGTADTTLVDDAADCDEVVVITPERSGVWFAYDSSPALTGNLFPAPGAFQMTNTGAGMDCAAHVFGGGYPFSEVNGYGYAGIGLSLDDPYGDECPQGYDADLYDGFSFTARGSGWIRVLVETVATEGGQERPNGYVGSFQLTSAWATYSAMWRDLQLLDSSTTAPERLDATRLRTIRFEALDPTGFDFWIDDVTFTLRVTGSGGAPGVGGAGGAADGTAGHGVAGNDRSAGAAGRI